MKTEHPITPPPDLVREWANENSGFPFTRWQELATQAARWGADQELEACCEWIHGWYGNGSREVVGNLYSARRPKPPSLKEQALDRCNDYIDPDGIIRRALEALPDV